ncbi:MAG: FecR domain-containing protein, partial [Oscillospiraceae bacterium]
MKKLVTILLTAILVINSTALVILADDASATTMRLVKAEGNVKITNQTEKTLPSKNGSKLYNGYNVSTSSASYAHISLDSKKAIKLDQNSKAGIKKNGKKLEIFLNSGKIFFNVTSPLEADESLELRTSSMVTGIRGTAGTFILVNNRISQLQLYNGHAYVMGFNRKTGQMQEYHIRAGQIATFTT